MEDKKISEMAELLCKGAKMLSYYCPDCKVPLFQENTRIFCPLCGRNAIIEGLQDSTNLNVDIEMDKQEREKGEESVAKLTEMQCNAEKAEKLTNPENAIKTAIQKLARELEDADNADRIGELIDTIGKAVDVLEKLRKIYRNQTD